MEFTVEFFSNNRYDVLKLLCDNQIKVKYDFYVPLLQQEIADIAHFFKVKTNKLLKELMDNGFIAYFNGKSKYAITDKGYKELSLIQKNKY